MNIIKSLHTGLLHKTFDYQRKSIFAVSLLWGFKMDSGEPVLEQSLWQAIGNILGKNELFDAAMPKQNGEVLIWGSCFTPKAQPVKAEKVSFTISSIHKELFVYGNRFWQNGFIKGPEPFTEMPVTYANAFGGEAYKKNPVGKGFAPVETEDGKIRVLPNIEYPLQLIGSPSDRPEPAGFSRLDITWEHRMSKAGTYDDKYIRERMPGLPDDIDWSFFNDAASDQWIKGFFEGNETFEIINMNPDIPVQKGKLPGVYGRCFVNHEINGEIVFKEIKTNLDTIWFFPKDNMGVLIHRGTTEVFEDDGTDIKQLLLAHENLADSPRSKNHYQKEIKNRIDPDKAYKYLLYTAPLIPEGCRCGFEILQEESGLPLEMLNKHNMDEFARVKKEEVNQEAEKRKEEAFSKLGEDERKICLEQLEKIEALSKEEPEEAKKIKEFMEKIAPGITSDPENLDLSKLNLEAIDELTKYNEKLAEEKKKEAEEKLEDEFKKIKEQYGSDPIYAERIAEIENIIAETKLPPRLPRIKTDDIVEQSRAQLREIEQHVYQMREMGATEKQLSQIFFDADDLKRRLDEADEKLKQGYRIGAHYIEEARSPHEGEEQRIAQELIENYKQGKKTADGDYAFIDLSNQDLTGIDLSGSYLEYVNFTNTNLTGANLKDAILAHANLTGTILKDTNLSGANIGAVKINKANFINADLTEAILGKSKITDTKFHFCKLTDRMEMFLETKLENVDFTGSLMHKNNFIELNFSKCCFNQADLTESNFIKPEMQDTAFNQSVLKSVNFIQAQADNSSFKNAQMKNVRFIGGCSLKNTDFTKADVSEANLMDCNLEHADFTKADVSKANFSGSDLTGSKFNKANAVQTQFNKADLSHAELKGINLMEGSLLKAKLLAAKFNDANLYSVTFIKSTLGETDFTGAYLEKTILKDWRP